MKCFETPANVKVNNDVQSDSNPAPASPKNDENSSVVAKILYKK